MDAFFNDAAHQDNPLSLLTEFLAQEQAYETAGQFNEMRFVGYVLELGFDVAKIITSDSFKRAVGGIPRGSFLLMVPANLNNIPPHFTLLRVEDVAPTPLGQQVMQTYFELHKKSMPELDVWTQGELQWGALTTRVLGMYYPDPDNSSKMSFSGDVNAIVSAHRYRVYAPTDEILELIVNGTVTRSRQVKIGSLRVTECKLPFANVSCPDISVKISVDDFLGFRTAMFGKTRLGKSNVVKIIAQSILDATNTDSCVGQLIFDVNGEYANDNHQHGNLSLRSANESRCDVYSIQDRHQTPSLPLRLNFYEQPDSCLPILWALMEGSGLTSQYMRSFGAVQIPEVANLNNLSFNQKIRAIRKIQIFWAILHKAGYPSSEQRLLDLGLRAKNTANFNPGFSDALRNAAYSKSSAPEPPSTLAELRRELETIIDFMRTNQDNDLLVSSSGNELFDADDLSLLNFLKPTTGNGPISIRPFIEYHDASADNIVEGILEKLDAGRTVILDLGNANDRIRRYFSDLLSRRVFAHQEQKFTANRLGDHFIQIYFEEAHNLFPKDSKDLTDVYSRFAKEGAKFQIGIVYSTQSPSTISQELLMQSENFFVGHLASIDEAKALSRQQAAFAGLEGDILRARTKGYMRMLTFSHRFVVPVQVLHYEAVREEPGSMQAN